MVTPPASDPLAPDTGARLVDFARACKAATRIVALYPPSHPSVQTALNGVVRAGATLTADGRLTITVLPDNLLIDGRALGRSDPAVADMAAVLHAHRVGELAIGVGMTANGWHAFLSIVARASEDLRAEGGIRRVWLAGEGGPIDIREIDYAEVLRERSTGTDTVTWDRIIDRCLGGEGAADLDDRLSAALHEIALDPDRLADFLARLEHSPGIESAERRARVGVQMIRGLAARIARGPHASLEPVLDNLARVSTGLSPELVLALVSGPGLEPYGPEAPMDLGAAIRSRLSDDQIAGFVASAVIRDQGATARLAQAFQALVRERGPQTGVLDAAAALVADGMPDGSGFDQLWASAVEMLTSYSDTPFVSDAYARELTRARTQAVDVERASDDPPARVAAWLATVGDDEVGQLDHVLLRDLLRIEDQPDAWTEVLDVALARIERWVLVGDVRQAHDLLGAITSVAAAPDAPFAGIAASGLDRLIAGDLPANLVSFVRQAPDSDMALITAFCQAVGAGLVGPLAEALVHEDTGRTVRRLRDILITFGALTRAHANGLRSSPNPSVRRAAVDLLRAFGGDETLPDLRSLLDDADTQVQREALRAIIQIGTDEAFATLEHALTSGAPRTREAIMLALASLRDERAVPLLVYILCHTSHRGAFEAVYTSALDALGRLAADDAQSVTVLRSVLFRSEWWAPFRTARLRLAAARALAGGVGQGRRVLAEAAAHPSRGIRVAARTALAGASRSDR